MCDISLLLLKFMCFKLRMHVALVSCPSSVPLDVGINNRGINKK
jgi:hypothetical protein